jgi:hypothetical protein
MRAMSRTDSRKPIALAVTVEEEFAVASYRVKSFGTTTM